MCVTHASCVKRLTELVLTKPAHRPLFPGVPVLRPCPCHCFCLPRGDPPHCRTAAYSAASLRSASARPNDNRRAIPRYWRLSNFLRRRSRTTSEFSPTTSDRSSLRDFSAMSIEHSAGSTNGRCNSRRIRPKSVGRCCTRSRTPFTFAPQMRWSSCWRCCTCEETRGSGGHARADAAQRHCAPKRFGAASRSSFSCVFAPGVWARQGSCVCKRRRACSTVDRLRRGAGASGVLTGCGAGSCR